MTKVKRFTVNLDFQPASFTFICMVFIFSCLRSRQLKLINNKMTGGDFYCEGFTVEEKKSMCAWRSLVWFLFSLLSFFFFIPQYGEFPVEGLKMLFAAQMLTEATWLWFWAVYIELIWFDGSAKKLKFLPLLTFQSEVELRSPNRSPSHPPSGKRREAEQSQGYQEVGASVVQLPGLTASPIFLSTSVTVSLLNRYLDRNSAAS